MNVGQPVNSGPHENNSLHIAIAIFGIAVLAVAVGYVNVHVSGGIGRA
jgi:hypothetical protein